MTYLKAGSKSPSVPSLELLAEARHRLKILQILLSLAMESLGSPLPT